MKYKIGRKVFGSKDKVKNYFSYILKNTRDGEELTGDYLEDVIGLLQYHTERDEKIGCGIKVIKVERHIDTTKNQKSFTSHFQIYRLDGSDIDFSYNNCIRNLGNNYKDKREREKDYKLLGL